MTRHNPPDPIQPDGRHVRDLTPEERWALPAWTPLKLWLARQGAKDQEREARAKPDS